MCLTEKKDTRKHDKVKEKGREDNNEKEGEVKEENMWEHILYVWELIHNPLGNTRHSRSRKIRGILEGGADWRTCVTMGYQGGCLDSGGLTV